jgi:hypothetical protein
MIPVANATGRDLSPSGLAGIDSANLSHTGPTAERKLTHESLVTSVDVTEAFNT